MSSKHYGTIGILTSETSRFSRFWLRFAGLQLPRNVKLIAKMSLNIADARDEVLTEAEGDWVWFIDDDHTFHPNLLVNLLARNVDVVQPLVLGRVAPFAPVMMGPETEDKTAQFRLGLMDGEKPRLKEVGAVGAAGMLVRRHVWEDVGFPCFARRPDDTVSLSEDITFSRRATAKGHQIFVDMENMMGHLNVGEVWPFFDPVTGIWSTRLHFAGKDVLIPKATSIGKIVDGKLIYDDPPADRSRD